MKVNRETTQTNDANSTTKTLLRRHNKAQARSETDGEKTKHLGKGDRQLEYCLVTVN